MLRNNLYYFAAQIVGIDHEQDPLAIPGGDTFTFAKLLNVAYELAGIVAIVMIIIGGIQYATSDGDPTKLTRAKNTIVYSLVGLILIIMAAAITGFIAGGFSG